MGKVEDFSKVIKVVTELTDVTEEQILGRSREQAIVDARWMTIYFLRMKGYMPEELSSLLHHPIRTINHAAQNFPDRARYSVNGLGNIFLIARQQLL